MMIFPPKGDPRPSLSGSVKLNGGSLNVAPGEVLPVVFHSISVTSTPPMLSISPPTVEIVEIGWSCTCLSRKFPRNGTNGGSGGGMSNETAARTLATFVVLQSAFSHRRSTGWMAEYVNPSGGISGMLCTGIVWVPRYVHLQVSFQSAQKDTYCSPPAEQRPPPYPTGCLMRMVPTRRSNV